MSDEKHLHNAATDPYALIETNANDNTYRVTNSYNAGAGTGNFNQAFIELATREAVNVNN